MLQKTIVRSDSEKKHLAPEIERNDPFAKNQQISIDVSVNTRSNTRHKNQKNAEYDGKHFPKHNKCQTFSYLGCRYENNSTA